MFKRRMLQFDSLSQEPIFPLLQVLVVFSRHFVQSPWCQFELALTLRHVLATDDALVVACLDDMLALDVTPTMAAVLQTTTYIQWLATDPAATRSFWARLAVALQEVLP